MLSPSIKLETSSEMEVWSGRGARPRERVRRIGEPGMMAGLEATPKPGSDRSWSDSSMSRPELAIDWDGCIGSGVKESERGPKEVSGPKEVVRLTRVRRIGESPSAGPCASCERESRPNAEAISLTDA